MNEEGDRLNRAGLFLLACHGLPGATTGTGVGAGALTANWKAHPMTTATQATNVLQALEGHALLSAKISLDREGISGVAQFLHIVVLKILDADVWVDSGFGEDGFGSG